MSFAHPVILVFDSGLGGLTVLREIQKARPDARYVYLADNAFFPYGDLPETVLIDRVVTLIGEMITRHRPDLVVIACHTASTLVLPALRAAFTTPFIGTVPAIKPAAETSRSRIVGILATAGTAKRDYTRALIDEFAGDCKVIIHSPMQLATRAEAFLRGESVDDAAILADIAPCFIEENSRRTDTLVLACTHYPLLLDAFKRVAPWPVTWIDPAPAIARRVVQLIGAVMGAPVLASENSALFTSDAALTVPLSAALAEFGLPVIKTVTVD
jgi:glutamate racemase